MIDGTTFKSLLDLWKAVDLPFKPEGVPSACRASAPAIAVPGLQLRPVGDVQERLHEFAAEV